MNNGAINLLFFIRSFASNICSKIGEMIQGLATPVEVKLQLLTIFQHMHHDAQTIAEVKF